MRRSSSSSMPLLAIVQALTLLQLVKHAESYVSLTSNRGGSITFPNRQRQSRKLYFQRDTDLRQGREQAKVNLVSVRNTAPDDETDGETAASSVTTTDRDQHNVPVPHSSTPPPPNTHSSYSDDNKIAGATLGDIMSDGVGLQMTSHSSSGSTTRTSTESSMTASSSSSSTLAEQYGITHPLDRMALTANGNLQRLVSSYYDAPVSVVVDSCILRVVNGSTTSPVVPMSSSTMPQTSTSIWDRTVHLTVHSQTFCTAVSVITVYDPLCQQLVQSGKVGLGQLFRYLDLLPEFTLRGAGAGTGTTVEHSKGHGSAFIAATEGEKEVNSAGKGSGGGGGGGGGGDFWRDYTLSCAELTCDIHEEFRPGLWDMQPRHNNVHPNGSEGSASTGST